MVPTDAAEMDRAAPPPFRELSAEECSAHLAAAAMGRVAWSDGSRTHILPVSCALHAGRVVFRTSPYGALAQLRQPTEVAFEIDHADQASGTGWSVVVQGRTLAVALTSDLAELWARPELEPWAPGSRNLFLAITPHTISGRTVHAPRH